MIFETISILLPTRGRVKQLDRTVKSIRQKADQSPRIEIIFRCDVDDIETQTYLRTNNEIFIVGPREKGYASLPKFMNQCAALSSGDVIMMFNDDAIIETKGWDSKLLRCANQFPDGIFNIGVSTGLNDNLIPFSIVSKNFKEALGYVNDERLLFSDIFLLDVMERFGRVIRLPDVMFRHNWAGCETTDKTRRDAQIHENAIVFDGTPGDSQNPKKNWQKTYLYLHENAVKETVEKLRIRNNNTRSVSGPEANSLLQVTHEHSDFDDLDLSPPSYYDCGQLKKMLRRLGDTAKRNAIVLPVQENSYGGNPWADNRFWSKVFSCVYGISSGPNHDLFDYVPLSYGRIYTGFLDDAITRYRLRDICAGVGSEMYGRFSVLILNDSNYGQSLANYFIFKKILTYEAVVIFTHSPYIKMGTHNDRLIHELASGVLDYKDHHFESFRNEECGSGFTIEFL